MEIEDLRQARWFAGVIHQDQHYDDKPYTYHLEQVERVINRFGFEDLTLNVSAWLHDAIEDVPGITYSKIKFAFGPEVADIVYCVTNQMGRNRKEKFQYTYPKIRENRKALIVKLADRIANVEYGLGGKTRYVAMYRKEWADFKEALFDPDEKDQRVLNMWRHLSVMFSTKKDEK